MQLRGMSVRLILSIVISLVVSPAYGGVIEKDMSQMFPTSRDFHSRVYAWQPNMVPHSVVAYMDYDRDEAVDEALVFPYYSMNRLRSCDPSDRLKVKPGNLLFSVCDSPNKQDLSQPYSYITTTVGWVCETCIYEKLFGEGSVIPVIDGMWPVRSVCYGD